MKKGILIAVLLAVASLIFLRHRSGGSEALARVVTPAANEPAVDYSKWELLYENASLEQVNQDMADLRRFLDEGTTDYYMSEFTKGNYVVEGHFAPREAYELDRSGNELCARRFLKSGEVRKVVLPRDEFPDMYEVRDQIAWLAHRQDDLKALKALEDRVK